MDTNGKRYCIYRVFCLTHFDVSDDALILKNVAWTWLAIHLPKTGVRGRGRERDGEREEREREEGERKRGERD